MAHAEYLRYRIPIGGWQREHWKQARRAIYALARGQRQRSARDVMHGFGLLQRALQEYHYQQQQPAQGAPPETQPQEPQRGKGTNIIGDNASEFAKETEWIFQSILWSNLVKKWRNTAKRGERVASAVDLVLYFEDIRTLIPSFPFQRDIISMILDVSVHNAKREEAPFIAEALLTAMQDHMGPGKTGEQPHSVIWNQVINSWIESGLPEAYDKIESLVSRMEAANVPKGIFTWNLLIKYWHMRKDNADAIDQVEDILRRMTEAGVPPSEVTWVYVMELATSPEKAETVIHRMIASGMKPNVVIWTQLLRAWRQSGRSDAPAKAEAVFARMQSSNILPNRFTYCTLMQVHASVGNARRTEELFTELVHLHQKHKLQHLEPDSILATVMLNAYGKSSNPHAAANSEAFIERIARGKLPSILLDEIHFNTAIATCLRHNDPERADRLLVRMDELGMKASTWTYNVLMTAWSRGRSVAAAVKTESILSELIDASLGAPANVWSFNTAMDAWVNADDSTSVDHIRDIYEKIPTYGLKPNAFSRSVLISGFIKSENLETMVEAETILRDCLPQDALKDSYSAFRICRICIEAWIDKQEIERADSLLELMCSVHRKGRLRVDAKVYFYIMKAWISAGDLERADDIYRRVEAFHLDGLFSNIPRSAFEARMIDAWKASVHPEKDRRIGTLKQNRAKKSKSGQR
jgi:pentatricopeptide repeat protein